MPFTISHAAAAIPFVRTSLVLPALIIGTMTPDFHYFLPLMPRFVSGHTLAGIVTVDLIRGLMVFVVWAWIVVRPAVDLSPDWVHSRISPAAVVSATPRDLRGWLIVAVSILVGAATHVFWDSFTHAGRFGTETFPFLEQTVSGHPVYRWLQMVSSVAGLLILAGWMGWWYNRTRPVRRPRELDSARWRHAAWAGIVASAAGAALAGWLVALGQNNPMVSSPAVYAAAVFCMAATVLAGLVTCLLWYRSPLRQRGGA